MNEESSKFVDKLALEKLLTEKLELVHHYPSGTIDFQKPFFDNFDHIKQTTNTNILKRDFGFSFLSPISSGYAENETCSVYAFETTNATHSIVFQHGIFEDNRAIYNFLIKNLNILGINVYLSTMPYHYERKPADSLFSGEFFWSADVTRTRSAFVQGIYDLYTLYQIIRNKNQHSVILTGFSMGATLCLLLSTIIQELDGIVAINPAVSLSEIVWESPLCKTIKQDFITSGYTLEQIKNVYKSFEPACLNSIKYSSDRLMICYGIYDQVTSPSQYNILVKKWDIQYINNYKAAHLNILREPKLARDINNFIGTL